MKLGAVDFLQKPFDVAQVREMVRRLLKKEGDGGERGYADYLALAQERISQGFFEIAGVYAQKAVFLNPNRPEALNLLGGISETTGNRLEAYKYYQAALAHDPAYLPAQLNLERVAASLILNKALSGGIQTRGKKSRLEIANVRGALTIIRQGHEVRVSAKNISREPSPPDAALTPEEILRGKSRKRSASANGWPPPSVAMTSPPRACMSRGCFWGILPSTLSPR